MAYKYIYKICSLINAKGGIQKVRSSWRRGRGSLKKWTKTNWRKGGVCLPQILLGPLLNNLSHVLGIVPKFRLQQQFFLMENFIFCAVPDEITEAQYP